MQGITGNNNTDLTEMNRSAIIKILQKNEICTRAEIARLTGLTQAAITKIIATLIEMGVVSESGSIGGFGNRRAIGLTLNADKYKVLGVKFARNVFAVGVFDIRGKLYSQKQTSYSTKENKYEVISKIKAQIQNELNNNPDIVAIGLAVPGPYLREEGRIAIISQMTDWYDVNFIKEFSSAFSVPVFIEHDANAGALATWWFGERDNSISTLAYLYVGDGVGSGVIENGNLLLGSQGASCEIGHISIDVNGKPCDCGNYGCLELYTSVPAMLNQARERLPEIFLDEKSDNKELCAVLFSRARNGDQKALEVVEYTARHLAYGCVLLINAYNPDVIVIGDIMAQGGDLLLPTIQKVIDERVLSDLKEKVTIEISGLTIDPTLYGAAAGATEQVLRTPTLFFSNKQDLCV